MSDTVIQVENLGKKYIIGHQQEGRSRYVALRDVLADGAKSLGHRLRHPCKPRANPNQEEFWALKDVSFEVKQGEVVGIIGRNGAGKSTLLKILSRITEPTEGRIKLRGRVASLLEVGTGFHPELTGRENIFLNGAILGMGRAEINRKFDEIVEFAEVSRFLDTPVKRYSSGMYVRLAFAVAAHLEPEILVVDEVLAVGDAAFQKKCMGKMGNVAQEGRTILFVSHQMDMIRALCDRCILLNKGSIFSDGYPVEVIEAYLDTSNIESQACFQVDEDQSLTLQIISGKILGVDNQIQNKFDVFEKVILEFHYVVHKTCSGSIINFELKQNSTTLFFSFDTDCSPELLHSREEGAYVSRVELPCPLLKSGHYSLTLGTGIANADKIQHLEDILVFDVELLSQPSSLISYAEKRPGLIAVPLNWETKLSCTCGAFLR